VEIVFLSRSAKNKQSTVPGKVKTGFPTGTVKNYRLEQFRDSAKVWPAPRRAYV